MPPECECECKGDGVVALECFLSTLSAATVVVLVVVDDDAHVRVCVCTPPIASLSLRSGKTESINKEIETETATATARKRGKKKRSDNSARIISVISLVIGTCTNLKCNNQSALLHSVHGIWETGKQASQSSSNNRAVTHAPNIEKGCHILAAAGLLRMRQVQQWLSVM